MEELDLFAPYQRHSETSKKAALEIQPEAQTLRDRVEHFIQESGRYGATDEEIQDFLDMEGSTERPRRVELLKMGKIVDSGRKRKTRSNREAVVWRVV